MPEHAPASERADARKVQAALVYLAAQHSDDPERVEWARTRLVRWRARSGAHEQAWLEAERRWQMIHQVTPGLRAAVGPEAIDLSRRQWLKRAGQGGGLLALFTATGALGWFWQRHAPFAQTLLTAHAQPLEQVGLPDGSQLSIAADSSLQVHFSRWARSVTLAQGNVWFDVAHERLRAFSVHTRLGEVRVLGTAFSVSDRGGRVQVKVGRGRVQVSGKNGQQQVLEAGQQLEILPDSSLNQVQHVAALRDQQPRNGWWTFTDASLCEVVAEANAYLATPIQASPQVAGLRLTGSFPSDQPQVLLDTLPRVLPVRLVTLHGQMHLVPQARR